MDKNKLVAAKIKEVRKNKNLLQSYVAKGLGITENAYSRIESGQTQLTINYLYEISERLEEPVGDLLGIQDRNIANNNSNLFLSPLNNNGQLTISLTPDEFKRLYNLFLEEMNKEKTA